MIRKCYPGGKNRAFNISYDDGVTQDVRFVELLNRYGLKGTFNLNYGLLRKDFTWEHECGMTVRRLPEEAIPFVYRGHEVASHSWSHPYFDNMEETEILKELGSDKFFLERLTGGEVAGYATPFYYYSPLMAQCVRDCGFEYARISEESNDYSIPEDFYFWRGSKFHWDEDLEEFVNGFLSTDRELALCQLVGHSYDLDVMNLWDTIERICARVGNCEDVWAATHLEIVRYLRAMEKAVFHNGVLRNDSEEPLWFRQGDTVLCLAPGEEIKEE
jgi:hypothetical protein